jgi:hypothetical protein
MAGYNPGGAQHGYLWWLAWLDHNARTLFSIQDANGVFRPLFLQASCATFAQLANSVTGSETLLNLTPILTNSHLCPTQAAADASAYKLFQAGKLKSNTSGLLQAATDKVGGKSSSSAPSSGMFLPKLPTH